MSMEWQTKERVTGNKSSEWYLAISVIAIAIVVTSIILNNVLLAIIIGVSFVVLILTHRKGAQDIEVSITKKAIRVNDYVYTYENLEAFDIDEDKDVLILKSKKLFSPHIVVPIEDHISQDDLKDFLSKHLENEEMRESVFEQFMEYLGF